MTTIGFIGAGKMASAIIKGLDKTKFTIQISGHTATRTQQTAETLGVTAVLDHNELIKNADIVILAVKPHVIPTVLKQYHMTKPLVSIAAGVTLSELAALTPDNQPLIRVMPNINATIRKSTTGITKNEHVSNELFTVVTDLFSSIGIIHEIDEKDFGTFAALAGSSPAYIYMFIDAMSRAGVLHGLPKDISTKIVAETVAASADMLLTSEENPWSLVDKVSSPGGTTVAGVVSLEQHNFIATVIDAITATVEKNNAMSNTNH